MTTPKSEPKTEAIESQTVQNVQGETPVPELVEDTSTEEPAVSREAHVELAQDDDGQWVWCLWSANGRPMACSVMPFKRRHDAQKNITTVIELFRKESVKIVANV